MFKDPFSPDHTQKLEDEWLRYFKKNCKNPKMVSVKKGRDYTHDLILIELLILSDLRLLALSKTAISDIFVFQISRMDSISKR